MADKKAVVEPMRTIGERTPAPAASAGKTAGNTPPPAAETCAEVRVAADGKPVLRLIGLDGEVRYTAPLSGESILAALACTKPDENGAQVLVLRAISAVG